MHWYTVDELHRFASDLSKMHKCSVNDMFSKFKDTYRLAKLKHLTSCMAILYLQFLTRIQLVNLPTVGKPGRKRPKQRLMTAFQMTIKPLSSIASPGLEWRLALSQVLTRHWQTISLPKGDIQELEILAKVWRDLVHLVLQASHRPRPSKV